MRQPSLRGRTYRPHRNRLPSHLSHTSCSLAHCSLQLPYRRKEGRILSLLLDRQGQHGGGPKYSCEAYYINVQPTEGKICSRPYLSREEPPQFVASFQLMVLFKVLA
ncbi:hypothetical protein L2E82_48962 [Cichorium intybus]|uniref:Uncharacterized protein n=1 Tax=Cichorium intybus TaxID=13427 RepID=A0ACB8YZ58_CICIN|nr:hypothetical protein L2E82_48962 [Cichorium intybus]